MSKSDLKARMEAARMALERACELLTDPAPQKLADCLVELDRAAKSLADCTALMARHAGDGALLAQALHLRQAVRHAGFLSGTAADHHRKWLQILREKMGGYTAQGDPAVLSCAARVCLEG